LRSVDFERRVVKESGKGIMIDNLCHMLINTEPLEAINEKFDYKMGEEGHLVQTVTDDNFRRPEL
jgi:hypothetical protein